MKRLFLLACVFLSFSANAADVTVYPDCDYRGQSISLAPGDYTARELLQVGIPQDAISSIEVPRGLAVTVYENDGFKGRYGTLRRSDPCLVNDKFDNIISSLSIRETLDTVVQNQGPAQNATADNVVTVYADCEYRGRSAQFNSGDFNYSSLKAQGMPDNSISSIKVPKGFTVTLYDHDFLRGKAGRLQRDDACLTNDNFDNIVSSLSVRRDESIAVTPTPSEPTDSASAIAVYSQCNYGGDRIELNEGEYTAADLRDLGISNNSISSIRVGNGFQIELFENDFYRGRSGTLRQNDACLVDDRFNDVISSVVVSKNPHAEEPAKVKKDVATVYGFCNFKGGSVEFTVGEYDSRALAGKGISDNKISSIKVRQGYRVVVYADDNFSGKSVEMESKNECLDDEGLNDAISSLIVEKVPEPAEESFTELTLPTQQNNQVQQMDNALVCLKEYVDKEVCDSHRWRGMIKRCELANIELMMDGYLKGHIDAGNCRAELWDELARRVANPRLR